MLKNIYKDLINVKTIKIVGGGWEMKEKDIILTDILGAAIRNREFNFEKYKSGSINWSDIYAEASAHQVHTLIYPIIKKLDSQIGPNATLMARWNISVISCGAQMICDEVWLGEVIEALDNAKIQTMVLKGMAVNKCYPYPELRTMGDADILVHESDIDGATEILRELGYIAEKDQKTKHIEFFKKNSISIELHRLLIDYDFMRNKESFHTEIWESPVEINIGMAKAKALSWEMQVLHLCLHMAAHITYGGFGLRQLCDLVMVVEKKIEQINWDIIVGKAIYYGVEQFVFAIFTVCNNLFNMEVPSAILNMNNVSKEKVDELIEDIFLSGAFGKKDMKRSAANVLVNNSNVAKDLEDKNNFSKAVRILFPTREMMAKRCKYLYVKKNPMLLPFAWIHRIVYGLVRKDFDYDDKKALFKDNELNKIAMERNYLLEWLGLK